MSTIDSENIFKVKLAIDVQPKVSIDRNVGIIKYGKRNAHPAQLLFWINNHAEHGAIVKGKARYVAGISIKQKGEVNPIVQNFLDHANKEESWHDVIKKLSFDNSASGGRFVKAETNAIGTPIEYEQLNFAKCRFSDCGEYVAYCWDWEDSMYNRNPVFIPIWKPGMVGTCVFVYKNYSAGAGKYDGVYSRPEYEDCTLDIDTDVRLSTFFNSLIRNNFSAGTLINIRNGEPPKDKKKEITERLIDRHTGEDEAGSTVVLYTSKDSGPTELLQLNANDLDKQYQEVGKRNQQKILSGHGVNGVLFKIKTEGQGLNTRSEIVEAHELFINEYVKPEQETFLRDLKKFCKLSTGIDANFEFEQVKPIGLELPLENQSVIDALNAKDPNIIINYLIEKYSIEIPEVLDSNGVPVQESNVNVNENLKNLSGKQSQGVDRIVRKYNSQSLTLEQAVMQLVQGFGFTDENARKYIGANDNDPSLMPVQQSKQNNFFELFNKYAHDINLSDEVLDIQEVKFNSITEALQFEKVKFAEVKITTDLKNSILNEYKGDPKLDPEKIARKYDIPRELFDKITSNLIKGNLLNEDYTPTSKALNKETEPSAETTEIYTEYTYEKRKDLPGQTVMATTRDFCRDLVALTKTKALSFEAIFSMENELGENVWDYRGGFYTNPKTNETTPWCRHVWSAVTKVRRTSKNA